MLGFSMLNVIRQHSQKLDKELRQQLVHMYKPFRWIPCFLHKAIELGVKKWRKYPAIIELSNTKLGYQTGRREIHRLTDKTFRCSIKKHFASASCCSAELTADAIEKLLTQCHYIKKIHVDRKVEALMDVGSPSTYADELRNRGLTGQGVTIAVIDTGIFPHEDLTQPTNRLIAFKDLVNGRTQPYDDNGHGTHCAGDAAGNGHLSDGRIAGPASQANVIGVKVLDLMGSGSLSTVMEGVQWCIDNKERYNIRVISMSLGSKAQTSAQEDPMVRMVEKAWDEGMVVVVAAGNDGPDRRTIASPGISSKVITVGAMNDQDTIRRNDDEVASFSSRGPTIDGWIKPDILAPGVNVVSLNSPNSFIDKTQRSNRVNKHYIRLSGTSMATPICAGVIAQILQRNPHLTPNEVKFHLLNGAENWGLPPNTQGRGYIHAINTLESMGQS